MSQFIAFDISEISNLINRIEDEDTKALAIAVRESQVRLFTFIGEITQQHAKTVELMQKQGKLLDELTALIKKG